MFKITNFSQKSSSIPHFSTLKKHYFLATLSLPFLLLSQSTIISAQPTNLKNGHSNLELGVSPSEIAQDLVTNHLDKNNKLLSDNYDSSEAADFSTGFEDLDYWALELELAQEMVRLNKQKKFIEDQNELRKKMINSEVSVGSRKGVDINSQKLNTWQATEGVVDALIRRHLKNCWDFGFLGGEKRVFSAKTWKFGENLQFFREISVFTRIYQPDFYDSVFTIGHPRK